MNKKNFEEIFYTKIIRESYAEAKTFLKEYKINTTKDNNGNFYFTLDSKPYAAFLGGGLGLKFADETLPN